jgi:hypothetical protein
MKKIKLTTLADRNGYRAIPEDKATDWLARFQAEYNMAQTSESVIMTALAHEAATLFREAKEDAGQGESD